VRLFPFQTREAPAFPPAPSACPYERQAPPREPEIVSKVAVVGNNTLNTLDYSRTEKVASHYRVHGAQNVRQAPAGVGNGQFPAEILVLHIDYEQGAALEFLCHGLIVAWGNCR